MCEVTRILNAIERGDAKATDELFPLVYDELRVLAAQKLSHEAPGQTLQATALVHEAYVRLVGDESGGWDNRGHFFAAVAEAMRRILVENARRKRSQKGGGGHGGVLPQPDQPATEVSLGFVTEPPQDNEMNRTDTHPGTGLRKNSPKSLQE